MKIVFFTDFYHPSIEGVTASVELWATALRNRGHRVYIVAPAPAKPLASDHPDVIRLPSVPSVYHKGLRDGALTPRLGEKIRQIGADIYHAHTNGFVGLAGMRLMVDLHVPSVATYHTDQEKYSKVHKGVWTGIFMGSLIGPFIAKKREMVPEMIRGMKPAGSLQEWNTRMIQNLLQVCYQQYDHVIVPSEKISALLKSYGVTRPISIIPTGLEPNDFQIIKQPTLKSEKTRLLYVGRVSKEKNIDLIIDMMQLLQHNLPDQFVLKMVGPGLYLEGAKRRVKQLELSQVITFTGSLTRQNALKSYNSADMFIFPSTTDTQALVLNEAAYMHLPLLFSDPEISVVAIDGVSGYLLPTTPKAYADAATSLSKDAKCRESYGAAAHKLAAKLTMDTQVRKLETIYDKVIANHAAENS